MKKGKHPEATLEFATPDTAARPELLSYGCDPKTGKRIYKIVAEVNKGNEVYGVYKSVNCEWQLVDYILRKISFEIVKRFCVIHFKNCLS